MSTMRNPGISVMLAALWLCASGSQTAAQTGTITGVGSIYGTTEKGGAETPGRSGNAFPGAYPGGMVNWSEFGFVPSGGRFNPQERTLSPSNAHELPKA